MFYVRYLLFSITHKKSFDRCKHLQHSSGHDHVFVVVMLLINTPLSIQKQHWTSHNYPAYIIYLYKNVHYLFSIKFFSCFWYESTCSIFSQELAIVKEENKKLSEENSVLLRAFTKIKWIVSIYHVSNKVFWAKQDPCPQVPERGANLNVHVCVKFKWHTGKSDIFRNQLEKLEASKPKPLTFGYLWLSFLTYCYLWPFLTFLYLSHLTGSYICAWTH